MNWVSSLRAHSVLSDMQDEDDRVVRGGDLFVERLSPAGLAGGANCSQWRGPRARRPAAGPRNEGRRRRPRCRSGLRVLFSNVTSTLSVPGSASLSSPQAVLDVVACRFVEDRRQLAAHELNVPPRYLGHEPTQIDVDRPATLGRRRPPPSRCAHPARQEASRSTLRRPSGSKRSTV
jgi:hypothetical protein